MKLEDSMCEKCGYRHGPEFNQRVPRFRQAEMGGSGVLEWPCLRCGHVVTTPTLDAEKPLGPPNIELKTGPRAPR